MLEYICGNRAQSDKLWQNIACLNSPRKEEFRQTQLLLYATAQDRLRGDALASAIKADMENNKCKSMALHLELYDKITKRTDQPPSQIHPPGADCAQLLEPGLAQLLTNDNQAAEQTFNKLFDENLFPYNYWMGASDLYGAKLFLALRTNDNTEANRVLDYLSLTAGRVSPVLIGRLVPILKCCEKQTTSDSIKKRIRAVINLSTHSKGAPD